MSNLFEPYSLKRAMARSIRFLLLASNALVLVASYAQTGPGGVGNSTSNVLWLSADNRVYSNAGTVPATNSQNVQQWNDRSGNGRHAAQATAGNRPNYFTGAINGYPVLRYIAGNNDRMLSSGLSTANVASAFVLGRYTSLPSPNPGLLQGTPSGNGYTSDATQKSIGMWVASGSSRLWGRGVQSDGTQQNISEVTALSANTTYVFNSVYDGSVIQQYVNNGVSGSVTYNGTLRSWTDMSIGCQHGNESWNGDIAEVIVYNVAVNEAQRIIIANYLAAKYGRTLAANDVYREDNAGRGNYDHEVAGIGRVDASNIHDDAQGSSIVRINNPTDLGNNEFMLWGHDNGMLGAWGVSDLPVGVDGRLERIWRVSERNAAGTAAVNVGAVDMTFDLSGLGNVDPDHLRLLVDTDQDGLFNDEIPLEGAYHVSGSLYAFDAVTQLTDGVRFTLGTTNMGITPLPIELVLFKARLLNDRSVVLQWATASEWDNDHFTIERSTDLGTWAVITRVEAVGHSNALVEYDALDDQPNAGTNYYRIRQTDVDGSSTTSPVEVVQLRVEPEMDLVLFPNPTNGPLDIRSNCPDPGTLTTTVLDGHGRQMMVVRDEAGGTLDLSGLASGSYILRVGCGDEFRTERVQLIR